MVGSRIEYIPDEGFRLFETTSDSYWNGKPIINIFEFSRFCFETMEDSLQNYSEKQWFRFTLLEVLDQHKDGEIPFNKIGMKVQFPCEHYKYTVNKAEGVCDCGYCSNCRKQVVWCLSHHELEIEEIKESD